ncbi:MAG TPA: ATP-dependent Clp protease proteolytic subunit [Burkholderiales bacterium]|jgi:hypothetical protein|nr:ATP-dependent Clp protease proteolytic subunit [Burkholderiales bacterium]
MAVACAAPAIGGVGVIDEGNGACLNPERACLSIYGYISKADAAAVRAFFANQRRAPVQVEVYLNSPGGEVAAALQIGRELRNARAAAYVFAEAQCASSCIFLLAGATHRTVEGAVAIHRPTVFDRNLEPVAEAELEYGSLLQDIRAFFQLTSTPEHLLEAMMAIPPEDAKYLTARELAEFGLAGSDSVQQ